MGRILCVTGTGTEAGKTALALAVLLWARSRGLRAGYVKLVQCGSRRPESEPFLGDADWIAAAVSQAVETEAVYTFPDPVSPHLAAERAGAWIDPDWLVEQATVAARRCDMLVVEGAGGAAAPFRREGLSLADVAAMGQWPCLIACPPGLGTLHLTRSTAHFLSAHGAPMAGFAMCQLSPEISHVQTDNRDTLTALLQVPCVGLLPYCPGLDRRLPLPPAMAAFFVQAMSTGLAQWWEQ